jgi:hypothetical protein
MDYGERIPSCDIMVKFYLSIDLGERERERERE